MIARYESAKPQSIAPGVERRILALGGGLMAVEFRFESGGIGAAHSHPHEQIGYVVRGRFTLEIKGRKEVIQAGDSYYAGPNVPHGVVALEDGVIFDVFSPQREDFLP
jgi:quercetin dioxygenase-like cupin family protein